MKIIKLDRKISKKYLRLASVYRRFAGRNEPLDFSKEALIECYEHETHGKEVKSYYGKEAHKNNGYIYGKWAKDVSVAMWIEDIQKGDACKAEFIYGINGWWAKSALSFPHNFVWFPFQEMLDARRD